MKKITVNDCSVNYAMYALAENLIPTFEEKVDVKLSGNSKSDEAIIAKSQTAFVASALSDVNLSEQKCVDANIPEVSAMMSAEESKFDSPLSHPKIESEVPSGIVDASGSTTIVTELSSEEAIIPSSSGPSDFWACEVCTFLNDISESSCAMCGVPNSTGERGSSAEDAPGASEFSAVSATGGVAAWWCSRCTFMNPLNRTT
jgi:hypothetical protein